jgi:prepilin-type processing-associated H-X9-DG protein
MVGELSWKDANCFRSWSRGFNSNASPAVKNVVNPINAIAYDNTNFNDVSFGSPHSGGCNFVLGDGSVRFISQNITQTNYLVAASKDGGEAFNLE